MFSVFLNGFLTFTCIKPEAITDQFECYDHEDQVVVVSSYDRMWLAEKLYPDVKVTIVDRSEVDEHQREVYGPVY